MSRDLLFLSHRIPHPPNKGDKIRSHHLFRFLARRYRVHLGTFIDDPADWRRVEEVKAQCEGQTCILPLKPAWARLRSLSGLITGEPLTLPYLRRRAMKRWIDKLLDQTPIERIVVYSSGMAPYVAGRRNEQVRKVMDFVDVDSQKWGQYGRRRGGPAAWIYRREARRLLAVERAIAADFDASLLVSPAEAELLRGLAPESAKRIGSYQNGVDRDWFAPGLDLADPYPSGGPVIVFTGAMDYWPNAEAVEWFAREMFGLIRGEFSDARFAIVGSKPAPAVRRLAQIDGVIVTGWVADTRPYIAHAALAVAPMRAGQGIQNKVLEALAMGKPVVGTAKALEGMRPDPLLAGLTGDKPRELARLVLEMLRDPERARRCGASGRRYVEAHYDWERNLRPVLAVLEGEDPAGEGWG